jgi:hypothetical protein
LLYSKTLLEEWGVLKNFAAFCGKGSSIAIFTRAQYGSVSYTKITGFTAAGVLEDLF